MRGAAEECENWGRQVCVGSAGSAGVKESLLYGCVLVMGAHSLVIVLLTAGKGIQTVLPALS